jgi:hypothetical protein
MGGGVTIPKNSLVQMLEQGLPLDTLPDWQKRLGPIFLARANTTQVGP